MIVLTIFIVVVATVQQCMDAAITDCSITTSTDNTLIVTVTVPSDVTEQYGDSFEIKLDGGLYLERRYDINNSMSTIIMHRDSRSNDLNGNDKSGKTKSTKCRISKDQGNLKYTIIRTTQPTVKIILNIGIYKKWFDEYVDRTIIQFSSIEKGNTMAVGITDCKMKYSEDSTLILTVTVPSDVTKNYDSKFEMEMKGVYIEKEQSFDITNRMTTMIMHKNDSNELNDSTDLKNAQCRISKERGKLKYKIIVTSRPTAVKIILNIEKFKKLFIEYSDRTEIHISSIQEVYDGSGKNVDVANGSRKNVDVANGSRKNVDVANGSRKNVDVANGSRKNVDVAVGTAKYVDVDIGKYVDVEQFILAALLIIVVIIPIIGLYKWSQILKMI